MTRMVLTLILLASPAVLPADVLLIEQVRQVEGMTVPVNGLSKTAVEAAFGAPLSTAEPVGDPPITRWNYQHWSVYFEFDRVLFTVLNQGEIISTTEAPSS